jgi:ABC-type multidrug transport system fused ATPase/permease subunit
MIRYITDKDMHYSWGILYVFIFLLCNLASSLLRNQYIMWGMRTSIKNRRTLVAAMFEKVGNLSMKSLSETNSGKLVSLISSDLMATERGLAFSAMIIASPIVNIFAYSLIGVFYSWEYAGIVFAVWLFVFFLQWLTGLCNKDVRAHESALTDERLKFVNDVITGARNIKCYGWETHYLDKIKAIRKQ